MLESLGWPASVGPIEAGTKTEAAALATDMYGADKCGWEPLGE